MNVMKLTINAPVQQILSSFKWMEWMKEMNERMEQLEQLEQMKQMNEMKGINRNEWNETDHPCFHTTYIIVNWWIKWMNEWMKRNWP